MCFLNEERRLSQASKQKKNFFVHILKPFPKATHRSAATSWKLLFFSSGFDAPLLSFLGKRDGKKTNLVKGEKEKFAGLFTVDYCVMLA
jgi:hypothetical protein